MCDLCGDPSCPGGEEMRLSPAMMAAARRMDAISEALAGASGEAGTVDPEVRSINAIDLGRAYALTVGESVQHLLELTTARSGDVIDAILADVPPLAAVRGPLVQSLVMGWLIRDEQLKAEQAERAAAAGGEA